MTSNSNLDPEMIRQIYKVLSEVAKLGTSMDHLFEEVRDVRSEVKTIKHMINGNGTKGVLTRMSLAEDKLAKCHYCPDSHSQGDPINGKEAPRWKFWTAVVTGILAIVGSISATFFQISPTKPKSPPALTVQKP